MMISSYEKLKSILGDEDSKKTDLSSDEINQYRLEKNSSEKELKKVSSQMDDVSDFLSRDSKFLRELNKRISNDYFGNVLISCDSKNNKDLLIALVKKALLEERIPIVILTANNYKTVSKEFKEANINLDKVYIIDTVSKNIISIHDFGKIIFIDSLRNLTQLQIKLLKLLKKEKNVFCIFDTVDILDLYYDEKLILKFIYSIIKLIQKKSASSVFLINNNYLSLKVAQFFTDFFEIEKID